MAAVLLFFSLCGFTGFNFSLSIRESVAWNKMSIGWVFRIFCVIWYKRKY